MPSRAMVEGHCLEAIGSRLDAIALLLEAIATGFVEVCPKAEELREECNVLEFYWNMT